MCWNGCKVCQRMKAWGIRGSKKDGKKKKNKKKEGGVLEW